MTGFGWWAAKATANARKDGVTFDEGYLAGEDRFLLLGMSMGTRLLLVCHCEREKESIIRIISARRATPSEAAFYESETP